MVKVSNIGKARSAKIKKAPNVGNPDDFNPCSQDMTICGDCEGNRAKNKCPRLKEWLGKRQGLNA